LGACGRGGSSMDAREFADGFRQLADRMDKECAAAFDLWTWLPSHDAAEKAHGAYADNYRPSNADVMREAATVLAYLLHGDRPDAEECSYFRCPCDEHERPESDDEVRARVAALYCRAPAPEPVADRPTPAAAAGGDETFVLTLPPESPCWTCKHAMVGLPGGQQCTHPQGTGQWVDRGVCGLREHGIGVSNGEAAGGDERPCGGVLVGAAQKCTGECPFNGLPSELSAECPIDQGRDVPAEVKP